MSYKYEYSELEQFLSEKRWVEADQVTANIILRMANQGNGEGFFLTENSIKALPCEGLNAIDSLWTHYSNGLFGFSVQVEIWKSLGSPRNLNSPVDIRAMDSFCHQVGWSSEKDISEILDKGCFPATYAIRTKGNDGNLDYKLTPLAYTMVGIIALSVLFTNGVIVGGAIFLISALIDIGLQALGFGSLAFFQSRAWCMLLSRMTECKSS
jgi:hypothetical protein